MIEPSRRSLIIGLTGLICAPAIVRASSLMKVKVLDRWDIIDKFTVNVPRHPHPGGYRFVIEGSDHLGRPISEMVTVEPNAHGNVTISTSNKMSVRDKVRIAMVVDRNIRS